MTARKINFYLGALRMAPDHQRLFGYMEKLTVMQQVFTEIAPPQLAQRCALGRFIEGNLTIYTHNGAIAAKLRQTLPSLLQRFQARGYEITAIRVAVQANYLTKRGNYSSTDLSAEKRRIGRAGMESLTELAAKLPQSPLKTAVESLLKKQNG
ncbi:MAG: DUF721 domain-containing protein [Nitrosospira sp.]|nr:DUF721 domain-containing protein [Nitrosospira sp.]MDN5934893.1 DUF721 domain-containing protein [Nitrosospira sp.]